MRPNILFILVDCLRADYVFDARRLARTPTLDALRGHGAGFTQAIASASTTTPCVASLLTGLYSFAHGVRSLTGYKLGTRPTLPELLSAAGYRTYAEVTGPLLPQVGLSRGFDEYNYRSENDYLDTAWGARLRERLARRELAAPWFLFLHLWELHLEYPPDQTPRRRVPPAFDRPRFGRNRYARALSGLDARLAELLSGVDLDRALVVLHGDHGERIHETLREERWAAWLNAREQRWPWLREYRRRRRGAHNFETVGHGFHIYDYLVRVPLVFSGAPFPRGLVIPEQVRQVDILPTLLEAAGLDPGAAPPGLHGRSLMPLARGEALEPVPAYAEACGGVLPDEREWRAMIRTPQYKFIFGPNNPDIPAELYDLARDPRERHSLARARPDLAQALRAQLLAVRALESPAEEASEMSADEQAAVLARLKALGYVE